MRSRHLSQVALLGLAGDRLTESARRAAEEHLAECARCRGELTEFRLAHSVVERVAEIGYQEGLGELGRSPAARSRDRAFPWRPVAAISLGCACVMSLLFYPRVIPSASAAGLLSSAIQNEDRSGDPRAYRVQVSGLTCAGGQAGESMVSLDRSDRCSRALQHLHESPWGRGNPLSARTYASWRNTLHRRHDRVTRTDATWKIQTASEESTVRAASLVLRSVDLHATELTLDFADSETVSISEAGTLPGPRADPAVEVTSGDLPAAREPRDDPGDLLEVQAWYALHSLEADSGWEAAVLRDGRGVRVKAMVADEDRKAELERVFAQYPAIVLDLRTPDHPGDLRDLLPSRIPEEEDGPALAGRWLEMHLAQPEAEADFSNRALRLSRQILGRSFLLERLRRRQTALGSCSCAKGLARLVQTDTRALWDLQSGLALSLEPLLGSSPGVSRNSPPSSAPGSPSSPMPGLLSGTSRAPLTYAEARDLDGALHALLWRSSRASGSTFDTTVRQIRRLLARR